MSAPRRAIPGRARSSPATRVTSAPRTNISSSVGMRCPTTFTVRLISEKKNAESTMHCTPVSRSYRSRCRREGSCEGSRRLEVASAAVAAATTRGA